MLVPDDESAQDVLAFSLVSPTCRRNYPRAGDGDLEGKLSNFDSSAPIPVRVSLLLRAINV